MSLEQKIHQAYEESALGRRTGDSIAEVEEVREYIKKARIIVVPNWNDTKLSAINIVLEEFGLSKAEHLQFYTSCCDISRIPAISKAHMALDLSECDLVIARGRLGVPGSGSLLVIMDKKGRILSAGMSAPHVLHDKSVTDAVQDELSYALERIGFTRKIK